MEDIRFDTITKALGALTTRRWTAGALLAGALSVLGLSGPDDAEAAETKMCKPKCNSCEKCDEGTCEKKNGKKRCKKGKCKLKPNGTLRGGNLPERELHLSRPAADLRQHGRVLREHDLRAPGRHPGQPLL